MELMHEGGQGKSLNSSEHMNSTSLVEMQQGGHNGPEETSYIEQ